MLYFPEFGSFVACNGSLGGQPCRLLLAFAKVAIGVEKAVSFACNSASAASVDSVLLCKLQGTV
eukprot:1384773-Amphidinium_carterae.1